MTIQPSPEDDEIDSNREFINNIISAFDYALSYEEFLDAHGYYDIDEFTYKELFRIYNNTSDKSLKSLEVEITEYLIWQDVDHD